MPSGITAPIYEGQETTFEQFMLRCARHFGALMFMREEPMDAPIPNEILPEPRYKEQLEIAIQKYNDFLLNPPTDEELEKMYQTAYEQAEKEHSEHIQKKRQMEGRYREMLEKVYDWTPPTREHEELKDFAVQQLLDSIRFDCRVREFYFPEKKDWINRERNKDILEKEINVCKRRYEENLKSAKEKTEWIQSLKASLC